MIFVFGSGKGNREGGENPFTFLLEGGRGIEGPGGSAGRRGFQKTYSVLSLMAPDEIRAKLESGLVPLLGIGEGQAYAPTHL